MSTVTENISPKDKLIQLYEDQKDQLFGAGEACVSEKRKEAILHLANAGIPNKKNEEYKYTNIEAVLKQGFEPAQRVEINADVIEKLDVVKGIRVVFVNGFYSTELSKIEEAEGVVINSFSKALTHNHNVLKKHFCKLANVNSDSMIAMNTSLFCEGVFIHILKNAQASKPIHLIYISTSEAENVLIQPRALVVAESGSAATIIESFESFNLKAKSFTNSVAEFVVCENAHLDNYLIQNECENANQVNTKEVHQEKNSNFTTTTITTNGSVVRNNLNIALNGENIESNLNGLYLADKKVHIDNHTLVDHRMPHCNSNELYKGIASGNSTAVFNGKIYVRQDAQKTNAFQSNKNVLLSDNATVNTKPQLEIYADDVKCSHGTSTGKIDEAAMFYLRSRGIGEDNAKKLLMHAFAGEVLERIKVEELKGFVEELVERHFEEI